MRLHHRKKFLNKGPYHSDANIFTSVYMSQDNEYSSISASLRIKDCNESISLAVELEKAKMFKNTISKLDILMDEISRFKEACIHGREKYVEGLERIKEYKKQSKLKENGKSKRISSPRKRATGTPVQAGRAANQRTGARLRRNS